MDTTDKPGLVGLEVVSGLLGQALPVLLAHRGDMLAVKDARGAYVHVDARMATLMQRDAGDVIGRTDAEIFDATVARALRAAEQTALSQTAPLLSEHAFEWRGRRHEFSVLRTWWMDAAGRRWLCSLWTDTEPTLRREGQLHHAMQQLEQEQRVNQQLRREFSDQALRDQASGLHTRGHFEEQLRRELDLSTREHREFAVVLIEIDEGDATVRALGEAAQERIFEAMGRLLRSSTRAMDASCRWEERRFSVLLSGVGLATAHARVETLRRQCATQIVLLDGRELRFTASMGVASFPHTADNREALLSSCESALHEARRRGGNQVTLAAIRFESAGSA